MLSSASDALAPSDTDTDADLYSPDVFIGGVPHATLARLRREDPVHWQPIRDNGLVTSSSGYWAVTRYRDIITMSRDPQTFSSARTGTQLLDLTADDLEGVQMMMLNMDPPQHVKFRNLVRHGFIPKMIHVLEPRVRARVRDIVDDIARKGQCDFVTEVAARLPLEVIAEMLGIPESDRQMVFDWTNRLIGYDDPEYNLTPEDQREAAMQVWMYAAQLAESRRGKDGTDLVSVLTRSEVNGENLTDMEMCSFFLLLAVAGNETTRNATTGGMLALLEHPEQRALLLADPSRIPGAVEEMLRWVTPVIYMSRTATRDVELGGKQIKQGDRLAMYYSSANRDESVFPDPFRFDITRHPNEHIAFGIGQHVCLGHTLARLELKAVFEELLARLPDMQLAGSARRLRSNFINGVKEMQVEYTPEKAVMRQSG